MEELYPDCFVRMTVGQLRQFDTFNVGKLTVKGTAPLDLGTATGYIGWVILETPGAQLSLTGFAGKTAVSGSSGADVIHAADGGSDIKGGAGNDWIYGGIGADTLTGGAGRDRFVFATDPSGQVDRITDFSAVDDSVMLDHTAFAGLPVASGSIGRAAFWIGTAAHDGTDRIIYDAQTGALYYDADGNGAGAQVQFAQVSTGLALTHADFIVI
jgi:Ca2+-binding RTX toxin-like protein